MTIPDTNDSGKRNDMRKQLEDVKRQTNELQFDKWMEERRVKNYYKEKYKKKYKKKKKKLEDRIRYLENKVEQLARHLSQIEE